MMAVRCLSSLIVIALAVTLAHAVDLPVVPKKLIIVDKLATAGSAKTVYVVKDPTVTKGAGVDPEQIALQFEMSYSLGGAAGSFVVPMGSANGWVANTDTVAKFVNAEAPGGSTQVKVAVIKPGKLLKVVAKGLGDVPLDLLGAGAPPPSFQTQEQIVTRLCVQNGAEESCFESRFTGCTYETIAGDTGAKLVCRQVVLPVPVCCEETAFLSFSCNMGSSATCAATFGTPGPVGSVCDATGNCVAPPGMPGGCCQSALSVGCGFASLASDCSFVGGSIIPGTVCERNGRCQ